MRYTWHPLGETNSMCALHVGANDVAIAIIMRTRSGWSVEMRLPGCRVAAALNNFTDEADAKKMAELAAAKWFASCKGE